MLDLLFRLCRRHFHFRGLFGILHAKHLLSSSPVSSGNGSFPADFAHDHVSRQLILTSSAPAD
jgi:hypothetical protein